jgi:phosphoribosylformylglycinamidine cyclo-ligase
MKDQETMDKFIELRALVLDHLQDRILGRVQSRFSTLGPYGPTVTIRRRTARAVGCSSNGSMKNIRQATKGKGEGRKPDLRPRRPRRIFHLRCGLVRFGALWCGLVRPTHRLRHSSNPHSRFNRNRPYRFYTDFIPVFRFLLQICEPTKSPKATGRLAEPDGQLQHPAGGNPLSVWRLLAANGDLTKLSGASAFRHVSILIRLPPPTSLPSATMKRKAYARAGVDIDLGNRVKSTLPQLLRATHRVEVLGKVGGFGGLFALDTRKYRDPVLVSSVDGVGTKLKLAFAMKRHDTIGQDLVNHCVNDIAVLGAEPLFFLDYIGTGKLEPRVFTEIITGFAKACTENRCALIGGETAQMPGFYQPGEYDVSGTIVGVVEKSKMLDGRTIRPGDAVIGLASSGLHTNGYSLARKIFFDQLKLKPSSRIPELANTLGGELLKVHVSYGPLIQKLLSQFNLAKSPRKLAVKGLAHITGGGFVDNIPRVLPKTCDVLIHKGTWEPLPIFEFIKAKGRVPESELYQVFNMGIGMTLTVASEQADAILRFIRAQKQRAWLIGDVVRGEGMVRIE